MISVIATQRPSPWPLLSVLALAFTITCSCQISVRPGYITEDKKAADTAIVELHHRFNAREHEKIYDDAHSLFKTSRIKSEFCDDLKEVHETMGEFESVTDKWINVVIATPVEIRAIYNTKFTNGDGTEGFVFLRDGDTVRLVQYQISRGTAKPGKPEWRFE